MSGLKVFSGSANRPLAQEIAERVGIELGQVIVTSFKDGEIRARILENIRGYDVFIIQPTCNPVNQHLMELLLLIDAARRASAASITAVIPYYGYARQERKTAGREPISAKLVANLITVAGADRVLSIDLHAPAIEGFFDIPVDHLRAGPILANYFQQHCRPPLVVAAPDEGAVERAIKLQAMLGHDVGLAVLVKHRPEPDKAEAVGLVGDVRDRTAILVDDLISTGGTMIEAAECLLEQGASAVFAGAVHPVLAGDAAEILRESVLERIVVTNTIPVAQTPPDDNIVVLSVAPLLAEAISRIHENRSVSALFD
ncbi:MAG: ribose-phosphate diphosphokinase [Anaerolineae bacterium]